MHDYRFRISTTALMFQKRRQNVYINCTDIIWHHLKTKVARYTNYHSYLYFHVCTEVLSFSHCHVLLLMMLIQYPWKKRYFAMENMKPKLYNIHKYACGQSHRYTSTYLLFTDVLCMERF